MAVAGVSQHLAGVSRHLAGVSRHRYLTTWLRQLNASVPGDPCETEGRALRENPPTHQPREKVV